jgi:rhodanese-related sulfurtransferase
MLSRRSVAVLILLGAALVACSAPPATPAPTASAGIGVPVSVTGGAYFNVTPDQLAAMLPTKDFLFINTHIPYEGEIENTDAFIPFEESGAQRVSEYSADTDAKIVLYCRSGRMSAIVAEELVQAGYTNVWNLQGGMIAWEQAGYEVQNP